MAAKRTKKPYLPDPKNVIEEIEVRPKGGRQPFRILRTNIVDPYEKPLPPPKPPRRRKR
jgi:hypothetical protein